MYTTGQGRILGGGGEETAPPSRISSLITQSVVLLKSSQSLSFEALTLGPKCSQNAVKHNFNKGEFF